MRTGAVVGLIACVALILISCGKGGDTVQVEQRHSAALPGLGGAVRVRVGDIKRGERTDVEVLGPGTAEKVNT